MMLKWGVKLLMLMVFFASSTFAFELSSNHYGAFGRLLKGKQTYQPSYVFPFTDAIQVDNNFQANFYTEKLPPILTENHSKFYFYAKDFNTENVQVFINSVAIPDSNTLVKSYSKYNDEIQLVEVKVSNEVLTADEAAEIKIFSTSSLPVYIYKETVSNHFEIYPSQTVFKKDGDFYRTYAILSHCIESLNSVSIEFRNQTFDIHFNEGFTIQTIDLPLVDKEAIFTAKVFVDGLLYGDEEVKTQRWMNKSIHLIPLISPNKIQNISSELPVELSNTVNWNPEYFDNELYSRQVNYSVYVEHPEYKSQIGFLQEKDILKYSTIHMDKPYPSRDELSRMMDVNIKTLGYFQKERFGYPDTYFEPQNMAYIYEDGASRELLVYKQYNAVRYLSDKQLEDALLYHEYKLTKSGFPFNQSLLFVDISNQSDIGKVQSFINKRNKGYQSPMLSLDNFNQFGKLFTNRNRTKLAHKVQTESPYRLSYNQTKQFDVKSHWSSVLSDQPADILNGNTFSVFNPGSDSYDGIITFRHNSNTLKSAEWSDGTPVKIQKYKPNHYFMQVSDLKPFEVKRLSVSERILNVKSKPQFLSIHKRTGVINWQYKGNKISRKKENLFVPVFKIGLLSDSLRLDEGYLKTKGKLFTEYVNKVQTKSGSEITINTYVFNDLPLVKYMYQITSKHDRESTHIQFNYPQSPGQYSIDRIYKEEYGFSKYGNQNVLESDESIFLINKTKILLSSPQNLRWQYNSITYNTNEVGYIESSTYPNQMFLLVSGDIHDVDTKNSLEKRGTYELDVRLGDENDNMTLPKDIPFCIEHLRLKQKELQLFKVDNSKVRVVNIHQTEKDNQFVLELKNTSDVEENATFTPRRNKSTVYECLFSGKKTGIVKGKLKFEPQELKTIHVSL